jgi:type III restriction enzyme
LKVPHVCVKVPTGGGKTFIAACAIKPVFDRLLVEGSPAPRVVVWLAPSVTIRDQTVKALSDSNHPYRRTLAGNFSGRIEIYDKDALLQGTGFSPDAIRGQLSIVVLSYDSLRATNKESRKLHQANGALMPFSGYPGINLDGKEAPSVIDVIRGTRPVVIVDESHNATTPLSRDMLSGLNPSFVLDLTATPRSDANIISFVNALALKKEQMVKLPVMVQNRPDKESVVTDAIDLRDRLERAAEIDQARYGRYVRPIVLFQAESKKGAEDRDTYERVRHRLLDDWQIPVEQIAIKTAEIDELKGRDLLSPDCPIRFIITVNALKEGWDCPFAYILASLADRHSPVDVQQIVGRVLRQPYAMVHAADMLNMSYVLTASVRFGETLRSVMDGLCLAGFSENDCRVLGALPEGEDAMASAVAGGAGPAPAGQSPGLLDPRRFAPPSDHDRVARLLEEAREQGRIYTEEVDRAAKDGLPAQEVEDAMSHKPMKATQREVADRIELPQFFLRLPQQGFLADLAGEHLLARENLLEGFRLGVQNAEISFEALESESRLVDLEEVNENGSRPVAFSLADQRNQAIAELVRGLDRDKQIQQMKVRLTSMVGKMPPVADSEIRDYIGRILTELSNDRLQECIENPKTFAKRIREKIRSLEDEYAEDEFRRRMDRGSIIIKPSWHLPKSMTPPKPATSYERQLYEAEWDMNNFEERVIREIAALPNIEFWHRNPENDAEGFKLNGPFGHFPDFMVLLKSGLFLLVEAKGDFLDNSSSAAKLRLGERWATRAGPNFRYFMVFDKKEMDGAMRLPEFIGLLRSM